MKRYFYVGETLNDLVLLEQRLVKEGLSRLQMHLVSDSEAEAEELGLHQVASVLKKDIIYSMLMGFCVGVVISIVLLAIGTSLEIVTAEYSLASTFFALFIIGFCTWEGGLFGIQVPNRQYRRFSKALKQGHHVFFVDVAENQDQIVASVAKDYPQLEKAGSGKGEWQWIFSLRNAFYQYVH